MKLFLAYASPDKRVAEAIQLALLGAGHQVFFDEASLPPGGDYNYRIREAICESDVFIFLISPNSVSSGRYVQTELQLAKTKWPKPWGVVLPVMIAPTEHKLIDPYLAAVTILEPRGSAPAEVAAAVLRLRTSPDPSEQKPRTTKLSGKRYDRKIVVFIALAAVIVGGAIFLFWQDRQKLPKISGEISASWVPVEERAAVKEAYDLMNRTLQRIKRLPTGQLLVDGQPVEDRLANYYSDYVAISNYISQHPGDIKGAYEEIWTRGGGGRVHIGDTQAFNAAVGEFFQEYQQELRSRPKISESRIQVEERAAVKVAVKQAYDLMNRTLQRIKRLPTGQLLVDGQPVEDRLANNYSDYVAISEYISQHPGNIKGAYEEIWTRGGASRVYTIDTEAFNTAVEEFFRVYQQAGNAR